MNTWIHDTFRRSDVARMTTTTRCSDNLPLLSSPEKGRGQRIDRTDGIAESMELWRRHGAVENFLALRFPTKKRRGRER